MEFPQYFTVCEGMKLQKLQRNCEVIIKQLDSLRRVYPRHTPGRWMIVHAAEMFCHTISTTLI